MTTESDGAPNQGPLLHLRVETLSFRPDSTETVEALAGAVDDESGLVESIDARGRQRVQLVRGVTVVVDTSESYLFGRRARIGRTGALSADSPRAAFGSDQL
jgi:hypothetical protein